MTHRHFKDMLKYKQKHKSNRIKRDREGERERERAGNHFVLSGDQFALPSISLSLSFICSSKMFFVSFVHMEFLESLEF